MRASALLGVCCCLGSGPSVILLPHVGVHVRVRINGVNRVLATLAILLFLLFFVLVFVLVLDRLVLASAGRHTEVAHAWRYVGQGEPGLLVFAELGARAARVAAAQDYRNEDRPRQKEYRNLKEEGEVEAFKGWLTPARAAQAASHSSGPTPAEVAAAKMAVRAVRAVRAETRAVEADTGA
eukprot:scaffold20659_cov64-Phaeocystis_antarctica.AAC.11